MYDNDNLPSDILDICKDTVPDKSLKRYVYAYDVFIKWRTLNGQDSFGEPVLLAYFNEMSKTYKPSSLWSIYSMLRCTIMCNHNVDISVYRQLIDFLKKKAEGFQSKKARVFTAEDINKFLIEAPDDRYLAMKAVLVFGVIGAGRLAEITDIKTDYVQDNVNEIIVRIPDSSTKIPKACIIDGLFADIVRKYMRARSDKTPTDRFFMQYRDGRCTIQVIGRNTMAKMPKEIAKYLQLPDWNDYTGNSFRRTSSTILADTRGYKRTIGNYFTERKEIDPLSGSAVTVKQEMIDESFSIIEMPSEADLSHQYENDSLSEFSITVKEELMDDPFTSTTGRNSQGIKLMSMEVSKTLKDAAKYGVDVCLLIQFWSEFDEKLISAMDNGTRSLSRNSDSSCESNYSTKSSSSGAVKKSIEYAAASAVRVIRKAERRTPNCRKRLLAICSQFKATLIQLMDTVALPGSGQSYVSQDTSDADRTTQAATNALTSTSSQSLNIALVKGKRVAGLSTGDFVTPSLTTGQSNFASKDSSIATHTMQSIINLLPSTSLQAMAKSPKACKRDRNGEILESRTIVSPPLQAIEHTSISQHSTADAGIPQPNWVPPIGALNSTTNYNINPANYPTDNRGHPNPVSADNESHIFPSDKVLSWINACPSTCNKLTN